MYDKRNAAMVLGCLLQQPGLLAETDSYLLTVDDFADRLHRIIFSTIFNMFHNGIENITVNEIHAYLKSYPELYQTFNDLKGGDAILTAAEIAEMTNFKYYYDKLKKMSLLRSLHQSGFDISAWYVADTYDISKRQQLEEKLEQATINDIVQYFTGKLAAIESNFVNRQSFKFGGAEDGIADLISELKKQPEIGYSLQGDIFTTISRGARKAKLYLASARSGLGKTRLATGQACHLAYPYRWNIQKEKWEVTGHAKRVLLITTELENSEIQTMVVAHLSGINEEKILNGKYSIPEEKRIKEAIAIMEYYKENLLIYHMPDPNVTQLNSNIRRLVISKQIEAVFMDYIHTSSQLLTEFSGLKLREDVLLLLLTTTLKNLANELDVFIWSGTQVNATEVDIDFADESVLRGSRAIGDKADLGCILRMVTPDVLKTIQPLLKAGLPRPNMYIDIYKNRRSKYKRARLWVNADLGICRFEDLFLTNEYGEQLTTDLIKAAPEQNCPTIEEIFTPTKIQAVNPSQSMEKLTEQITKKPTFTV